MTATAHDPVGYAGAAAGSIRIAGEATDDRVVGASGIALRRRIEYADLRPRVCRLF